MRPWIKMVFIFLLAIISVWLAWSLLIFQVNISVSGEEPVFLAGDRVIVSRLSYGLRLPGEYLFGLQRTSEILPVRGDRVAFNDPLSQCKSVSSRPICVGTCIALPGDTVWMNWSPEKRFQNNICSQKYPFVVPGVKHPVQVHPWNITLLANMLHLHEHRNVCWNCDSLLVVDGVQLQKVNFSEDYVWIFNQNNPHAYDSRIFGFLPYSHLIGRLLWITYSKDPKQSFFRGYRYERFLRPVSSKNAEK